MERREDVKEVGQREGKRTQEGRKKKEGRTRQTGYRVTKCNKRNTKTEVIEKQDLQRDRGRSQSIENGDKNVIKM